MVAGCSKSGKPGQEAEANAEEKDQQIAALRKQLAQAKAQASRAPKVEVVEAKVEVKGVVTDANGLIEKLADDSTTGADVASQRRVIHYFESLYDAGNDAVPAIADFLEQDLDKQFGRQSMRGHHTNVLWQFGEVLFFHDFRFFRVPIFRRIWSSISASHQISKNIFQQARSAPGVRLEAWYAPHDG